MKVSVFSASGSLLWSRELTDGHQSGFTSANYLREGTQQKIIGALIDALVEARGQLSRLPLQVVDAVSNVRSTAAKVDRDVPVSVARNWDASGQSLEETAVIAMLPATLKATEV